jgi:hypothetical protein
MSKRIAIVVLAAAAATLPALVGPGRAQAGDSDVATAQILFDDAKKLIAEGNFADACPKLKESQRLAPGIGTEFNLADCYEHTGKLASAWAAFLDVAEQTHGRSEHEREKVARDRAAALEPRLGRLILNVPPSARVDGLEVRRDGAAVGAALWGVDVPVDAGQHTIEARAPGKIAWTAHVTSSDGQSSSLDVPALAAAPPPSATPSAPASSAPPVSSVSVSVVGTASSAPTDTSAPSHLPAYLVGAGALALAGLGTAGLVLYNSKVSDYNANSTCPGIGNANQPSPCDSIVNQAYTWRTVGVVSFIAGGLALGAAVVLFVTESPSEPRAGTAQVRCGVGPGSLLCAGTF